MSKNNNPNNNQPNNNQPNNNQPTIIIDGKEFVFNKGETILQVAERNNIYIPKLCYIEGLKPYGGCRLCIVKVVGDRKPYQTSCSTPAQNGMQIITKDDELQAMRRETLQLLLSEHPSNCLVCGHNKVCDDLKSHPKSRPASRVFGCFACPSKDICELREIVEYLEIEELDYDFHYKNYKVKENDPFIIRDYNLCINCGRCVRVCSELRGINAIDFMQRGYELRIGTALDMPLVDSNCIFCGSCIDACPVGVYTTKKESWVISKNNNIEGLCSLCSIGCNMNFNIGDDTKNSKIIEAIPAKKGHNMGQACIIGRFCIPQIVHSSKRIESPLIRLGNKQISSTWEIAYSKVKEHLKKFDQDQIGIIASPDLTNEAAYLLNIFTDKILKTRNSAINLNHNIVSTIEDFREINPAIRDFNNIKKSSHIVLVDIDVQTSHQILLIDLIQAKNRGAKISAIHQQDLILPNETKAILNSEIVADEKSIPMQLEKIYKEGADCFIVGPCLSSQTRQKILDIYKENQSNENNISIIPLNFGMNTEGVATFFLNSSNDLIQKILEGKIKALITTERIAFKNIEKLIDNLDCIIAIDVYQNEFIKKADVVLPASTYFESWGSVINSERKIRRFNPIIPPLLEAKTDLQILSDLISLFNPQILKEMNLDVTEQSKFENNNSYKDMLLKMSPRSILTPNKSSLNSSEYNISKDNMFPFTWRYYKYRGEPIYNLVEDLRFIIEHRESQGESCEEPLSLPKEYKPSENAVDFIMEKEGLLHINGSNYGLTALPAIAKSINSSGYEFNLILDEESNIFNYYKEEEFCLCNNYKNNLERSNILINLSKLPLNSFIRYKNSETNEIQYEYIDKMLLLRKDILQMPEQQLKTLNQQFTCDECAMEQGMQTTALLAVQKSAKYATLLNKIEMDLAAQNSKTKNNAELPQWLIWNRFLHYKNLIDDSILKKIIEKDKVSVKIVEINPDKCIGCGRCIEACPHDAIEFYYTQQSWVYENKTPNKSRIDPCKCFKCATCIPHCPVNAINIRKF
ncbi:MAG: molybdopterin-dependent oxidoreductase [Promethearchaeota archaeon]